MKPRKQTRVMKVETQNSIQFNKIKNIYIYDAPTSKAKGKLIQGRGCHYYASREAPRYGVRPTKFAFFSQKKQKNNKKQSSRNICNDWTDQSNELKPRTTHVDTFPENTAACFYILIFFYLSKSGEGCGFPRIRCSVPLFSLNSHVWDMITGLLV